MLKYYFPCSPWYFHKQVSPYFYFKYKMSLDIFLPFRFPFKFRMRHAEITCRHCTCKISPDMWKEYQKVINISKHITVQISCRYAKYYFPCSPWYFHKQQVSPYFYFKYKISLDIFLPFRIGFPLIQTCFYLWTFSSWDYFSPLYMRRSHRIFVLQHIDSKTRFFF